MSVVRETEQVVTYTHDTPAEDIHEYVPSPRHKADLAGSALTGFTLMEAIESPWQRIREELEARIVDQPTAIDAILSALDLSEARLSTDKRPSANLAFLGPTGVGRSETAKGLAEALGEGRGNLIKIDCSNYSQGHEVAGLIGSPVGYIGHGQTPVLSKEVVETNGTVLLFDEIEKGSEQLYDMMLQIMGDGEIKLTNGDDVSFRDTLVIMTSNLGAGEMAARLNPARLGFNTPGSTPAKVELEQTATRQFEEFFKPEFVNRLDKLVVFHPLSEEGLGRVIDTKLARANDEYEAYYGVRLSLSDGARAHLIAEAAEQPHLGARPLVRSFEKHVQSTFGRYLGSDSINEGTHVQVFHPDEWGASTDGQSLVFASKPDETIRRTVSTELVVTSPSADLVVPSVAEPPEQEE